MCVFLRVCMNWTAICFRDCFSQLANHCDHVRNKTNPVTAEEIQAEKLCCCDKDTYTCNNSCVGTTCMHCHRCWCDCFLFDRCNNGFGLVATDSDADDEHIMDKHPPDSEDTSLVERYDDSLVDE